MGTNWQNHWSVNQGWGPPLIGCHVCRVLTPLVMSCNLWTFPKHYLLIVRICTFYLHSMLWHLHKSWLGFLFCLFYHQPLHNIRIILAILTWSCIFPDNSKKEISFNSFYYHIYLPFPPKDSFSCPLQISEDPCLHFPQYNFSSCSKKRWVRSWAFWSNLI